jgi:dTDP-4-amino-4,6-dideoxygalactose transaminase
MSRRAKATISDLAYFGGTPCFDRLLAVAHASTLPRERFFSLLEGVFDRGHFTNDGPLVQQLEERIADRLKVKHCIAICNGTAALQIAARAMGMQEEAIVPSFTFVATAHALQWQGIRPVFCDIDPATHTLDPACVESMLTPKTGGIIGVHLWGQPCDVDRLAAIARNAKIPLLFDAAHAFGGSHKGIMVGNFGNAEVFSFHATKLFHTFEGGAVATNDDDLAARVRLMRSFGFIDYDKVVSIGINGKMSEVSAAMGLAGLEGLDEAIALNRERHLCYAHNLKGATGIALKECSPEDSNCQYIVIEVDPDVCGMSRDQLLRILHAENVFARRYFYPGCHRMEPYRTLEPGAGSRLGNTERVAERVIVLPSSERIDAPTIEQLCELLRFATANGVGIAARLNA